MIEDVLPGYAQTAFFLSFEYLLVYLLLKSEQMAFRTFLQGGKYVIHIVRQFIPDGFRCGIFVGAAA
ncbi:MAG: hypothetical protein ACYC5K_06480 [Saccharofermentanales bacterium]